MAFSWLKLTLACIICAKCVISGAGAAAVKIVSFSELLYTYRFSKHLIAPITICVTFCDQIDVSFSYVCLVIDYEFRHNIAKVADAITNCQLSLAASKSHKL